MSHTYAATSDFWNFVRDSGNADLSGTTATDALVLGILEGASRDVDAYCDRSDYGSGFGPRTGMNVYDTHGEQVFDLRDDLLTYTGGTALDTTQGNATALVETTDIYLYPPGRDQKRTLVVHGLTTAYLGTGFRTLSILGTWGYSNETTGSLTIGTATASATSVTLTAGSAYAGHTLLVESEQMYVTASTGGTALTVTRGVNGTTAAIHAANTAASYFVYPREVTQATLLIAQRRWRMRDAGLTGDFGGDAIPVVGQRESERSLLRATVGHLRVYSVG